MNVDNFSEPKRLIHLLETAEQYTDPQKNAAMQNLAMHLMKNRKMIMNRMGILKH